MKTFEYSVETVRELAIHLSDQGSWQRWYLERLNEVGNSGRRVVAIDRAEELSDLVVAGGNVPYIVLRLTIERELAADG